jgi:disulfide bond formation protein DsbB
MPENPGHRAFANQLFPSVLSLITQHPRRVFAGIALVSAAMLAFGILYLQNVVGLQPCPMCIVQRECFIVLIVLSALGAVFPKRGVQVTMALLGFVTCAFGAFTAARQSWLQWNPPEFATCGRDLYGAIEQLPLNRILPFIFRGSGDCSAVDWTFLGMTIANWAFVWFVIFGLALLAIALRREIIS